MTSMIPKFIAAGCLLLSGLFVQAQQYPEWHQKLSEKTFALSAPEQVWPAGPFRSIKVIDNRDDTSSIGYHKKSDVGKSLRFTFQQPAAAAIQEYAAASFQQNTPGGHAGDILMVVKKLRLSEEAIEKHINDDMDNDKEVWERGVVIKAEFYMQYGDSCLPLYRFDSTLLMKEKFLENGSRPVEQALTASLNKLRQIPQQLQKRKMFSMTEIQGMNARKWQITPLTQTAPVAGVYRNFEEFKNNTPFYREFSIDSSKTTDLLFIKENGNMTLHRSDIWGYCDGRQYYIKTAENYFLLERCGNTFALYGAKALKKKIRTDPLRAAVLTAVTRTAPRYMSIQIYRKYYQLDMETGLIY